MMHAAPIAGIAAIGMLWLVPPQPPAVLMTIPQADEWRSSSTPAAAAVSADGRYVALTSYARLVPADTDEHGDIYVLDRASGRITIESLTADDRPLTGDSGHPRLSGDGRYLVFQTAISSANGAAPDTDVVVRDRVLDTSTRVSRDLPHDQPICNGHPAISEDGRLVVFGSTSTGIVAGRDENGTREDVYAFETATRALRRVSLDGRGIQPAAGASFAPSISGDGRYVAFTSTADLDGRPAATQPGARSAPARPIPQVYVRDLTLGTTTRASVGADGAPLDGGSYDPAISRDGRYVALVSESTNLTRGDRNRSADVFVRDMHARSTMLVSRRAGGGTANGWSGNPAISADGRIVVFQSDASDLECVRHCPPALDDVNLLSDVFLFDRATDRVTRMSAGRASGWAEESGAPQVDGTGTVVVFTSRHPIDQHDIRNDFDLFISAHAARTDR